MIRQFGPQPTKTDRDSLVCTPSYENGPWLVSLDPNLPKRTVIDQFWPKPTKMDRARPVCCSAYQNRPRWIPFDLQLTKQWIENLDLFLPKWSICHMFRSRCVRITWFFPRKISLSLVLSVFRQIICQMAFSCGHLIRNTIFYYDLSRTISILAKILIPRKFFIILFLSACDDWPSRMISYHESTNYNLSFVTSNLVFLILVDKVLNLVRPDQCELFPIL